MNTFVYITRSCYHKMYCVLIQKEHILAMNNSQPMAMCSLHLTSVDQILPSLYKGHLHVCTHSSTQHKQGSYMVESIRSSTNKLKYSKCMNIIIHTLQAYEGKLQFERHTSTFIDMCISPLHQLLQLTTEVLVVEEITWEGFKGIVADCHVKAGTECDDRLEAAILIVTEILGQNAAAGNSKRASLSPKQSTEVLHAQSIMPSLVASSIVFI